MNGFDDLMVLLRLVTDPEAMKARLQELQATIDAAAAKEAEAQAAHAELEAERSRLMKLDENSRARQVAVFVSEQKHESELEELKRWKRQHAPTRLVNVGPIGGLTKEPDTTELAPDPIDDPHSEAMDLASELAPVSTGARKSLRRIKI